MMQCSPVTITMHSKCDNEIWLLLRNGAVLSFEKTQCHVKPCLSVTACHWFQFGCMYWWLAVSAAGTRTHPIGMTTTSMQLQFALLTYYTYVLQ